MITEDYCSHKIAKLLEEKGFNENCKAYYEDGKFCWVWNDGCSRNTDNPKYVSCPTHQMAMKWLRKMHNIHIVIEYYEVDGEGFYGWIVKNGGERYHCHQAFSKNYEDAVELALKYSLENLI